MKPDTRREPQKLVELFQLLCDPTWRQAFQQQQFDTNVNLSPGTFRDHVSALSTSWDAVLEWVPSHVLSLKKRSNSLQPFHRLPVEVLVEIFWRAVLPIFGAQSHYEKTYGLMGVCEWWSSVIKAAPRFWSIISAKDSANHRTIVLSRSGPLLSIASLPAFMNEDHMVARIVPSPITAPSIKWKAVALSFNQWWTVGRGYHDEVTWLTVATPHLEEVTITSSWNWLPVDLEWILDGRTSSLRHLRIQDSPFTSSPSILNGLQSLTLSGFVEAVDHMEVLEPEMLFEALQSATQLRVLTLSNTDLSCCLERPILPKIELPKLVSLVWINGKSIDQEEFMLAVKMPRCSSIVLHSDTNHVHSAARLPFSYLSRRLQNHKNFKSDVDRTLGYLVGRGVEANVVVHKGTHRQSFRFTTVNPDRSAGLDVQRSVGEGQRFDPSDGLDWVVELFKDQLAKTPISLKVAGIHSHLLDFSLVPELPSISNITFHHINMDGPHPLTKLLGQCTHARSSNELRWPLPNLHALTIRESRSIIPIQLLSLVRNRYSLTQTRLPEDVIPKQNPLETYTAILPAQFDSIEIRYHASQKNVLVCDEEIDLKIHRQVGPGVFSRHLGYDDDRYSVYRTGDFDWSRFELEPKDLRDEILDNDRDELPEESDEELMGPE